MTILLTYSNGLFHAKIDFFAPHALACVDVVKKAGFKLNSKDGWFTNKLMSASLLRKYADEKAENIFKRSFLRHSPWKGRLIIPKGLSLLDGQEDSAVYSLSRNRSYLALAPGRGKTIVAAIVAATLGVRTLYICPPFLALNTLEEFQKWAPTLHTGILGKNDWEVPDVLIVPDSQIHDEGVRRYVRFFDPQLIQIDEAQRFKEGKSRRTKALLGYRDNRKKKYIPGIVDARSLQHLIYMGGTPAPNGRPMELYSIFSKSFGEFINFQTHDEFGMTYCGPTWNGFGYDFSGCTLKTFVPLMEKVKSPTGFMKRLGKDKNLPPCIEETVVLGSEMPVTVKKMENELLRKYSPQDLMKQIIALEQGKYVEDLHLATYRRLLGLYKVKASKEFIESILEDTDEKLVIFAIHKEVIVELSKQLAKWSPINASVAANKRHALVKEFQTNKNKRIFMGNIDAVGVGNTLTKAHRFIFIERSLVPGTNRQAIDRGHRHTLEHTLLVQNLFFRNSFDRTQYEMLKRKEHLTSFV